MINSIVTQLGFVLCEDERWRRASLNDGLSVEVDEYRITVYAETDAQDVRLQVASFPLDGVRFRQWLELTDGNPEDLIVSSEKTGPTAQVDATVHLLTLDGKAARDYATALEERAAAIRERTGTLADVDAARRKYGATLIRVEWQYADVACTRPELRRVCTWSNGDEGYVFVEKANPGSRPDRPLAKDPMDDPA
jgi:hypothetical protein